MHCIRNNGILSIVPSEVCNMKKKNKQNNWTRLSINTQKYRSLINKKITYQWIYETTVFHFFTFLLSKTTSSYAMHIKYWKMAKKIEIGPYYD